MSAATKKELNLSSPLKLILHHVKSIVVFAHLPPEIIDIHWILLLIVY